MKSRYSRALASAAAFISLLALAPTSVPAMSDAELEAIVSRRLSGDRTGANLAVAVIEPEGISRAFVAAEEGARALRIGPDSAFEIGSVTKTMTAALLADLILRGEASLDDPLSDWLPAGTPVPSFEGQPILLRHVVTHTSGLPPLPSRLQVTTPNNPYANLTEEALLASLAEVSLREPPGTQFAYSNFAFMLLSYALARHAETDLETLLRERLFSPLEMTGAYIEKRPAGIRAAVGHTANNAQPTPAWHFATSMAGVGGVRAPLDDMIRYVQAQLAPEEAGIGPALRLAHHRLHDGFEISGQPYDGLGIGWMQREVGGRTLIFHAGGTGGFSAFVGFDVESQRGVVALSDTAWNTIGGTQRLGLHLLAPEDIPLDAPRLRIDPPQELLDALAGEYQLAGLRITLRQRGGHLFVQGAGQPEFEMGYDTEGDFFPLQFEARLRPKQADGTYSFTWYQGGGAITATRIGASETRAAVSKDAASETPEAASTALPELALSEQDLAAYAGSYELMPGFSLTIRVKDGALEAQATGQPTFPLQYSSEDRFAAPAFGVEIHFKRTASGQVDALELHQAGQTLRGKRKEAAKHVEKAEPVQAESGLAAYAGNYELIPGFSLIIRVKGDALEAQAVGEGPIEMPAGQSIFSLQHRGKDRFSAFEIGADIDFKRDKTGRVNAFQIQQAGFTHHGKRKK
ncbi:hypothetical protein AXK11_03515 [Cephaloticoccus primus]|uniref:Beta-lactamase-related domain-containing protein n=1 Tax=Cephaloticoccus primus TaxID=1548207 RepID=A0A139SQL3_9BACT|nr:serine hydrolase [Cephaloticoccus primus]KXU36866.1 hypothetical protein AXK11_03515 [Cephaloticoccus primus]